MTERRDISKATRRNWEIDAALFLSAILASLSGIYFLFYVIGGYQGGRNPQYGETILFARQTWDTLHTWTGVAMILAAVVHIAIHWKWLLSTAKRMWKQLTLQIKPANKGTYINIFINAMIGLNFLLVSISGIYFLFFPGGSGATQPALIFSSLVWDLIHTWSGILMIISALLHFAIHWRWAANVTRRYFERHSRSNNAAAIPQMIKTNY